MPTISHGSVTDAVDLTVKQPNSYFLTHYREVAKINLTVFYPTSIHFFPLRVRSILSLKYLSTGNSWT